MKAHAIEPKGIIADWCVNIGLCVHPECDIAKLVNTILTYI